MNTATDTLESNTPKTGGGYTVGQASTDKVGFYGATPAVQPSGAAQAAVVPVTDGSTGTAAATNGIAALTASYNSTLLINSIATLAELSNANAAFINKIRTDLVALGLIAGA